MCIVLGVQLDPYTFLDVDVDVDSIVFDFHVDLFIVWGVWVDLFVVLGIRVDRTIVSVVGVDLSIVFYVQQHPFVFPSVQVDRSINSED